MKSKLTYFVTGIVLSIISFNIGGWNIEKGMIFLLEKRDFIFDKILDVNDNYKATQVILIRINDAYYGLFLKPHYFDSPVLSWILLGISGGSFYYAFQNLLSKNKNVDESEKKIQTHPFVAQQPSFSKTWQEYRPTLSDIDPNILIHLDDEQKSQLERLLNRMGDTDIAEQYVIVCRDNTVQLMSIERWKEINEQSYGNKFKLIYKK